MSEIKRVVDIDKYDGTYRLFKDIYEFQDAHTKTYLFSRQYPYIERGKIEFKKIDAMEMNLCKFDLYICLWEQGWDLIGREYDLTKKQVESFIFDDGHIESFIFDDGHRVIFLSRDTFVATKDEGETE